MRKEKGKGRRNYDSNYINQFIRVTNTLLSIYAIPITIRNMILSICAYAHHSQVAVFECTLEQSALNKLAGKGWGGEGWVIKCQISDCF